MSPMKLSWPEWKYPNWLGKVYKHGNWWIEQKKKDDGAEGLWRIHNGLYDLTNWADSHPGGKRWINLTKGLDVTETFESSHISPNAEKLLPKFYVRAAKEPRNSPYTFHPDGFFRTLKFRVYEKIKNHKRGPSLRSFILIDSFVLLTFILSIIAASLYNYYIGVIAGVFLTGTTILAHNFFHQKDSWRMYYFQLSLMSVTEWRITHGLSHHIYTNSRLDMEILMMQPALLWFPTGEKSWIVKYLSWFYSPIIYASVYHYQGWSRIITRGINWEDLVGLILPIAMFLFSGSSLLPCLIMWIWILSCGSFVFGLIGFNAAHHHPDIFHEGDTPRKDTDWGLNQIDAVSDRIEVAATFPWAHLSFGDHTLHHLFPTLDHDVLPELYHIFEKTCLEYGLEFRYKTTWDLITGQFKQLSRTIPNKKTREEMTAPLKKG